LLSWMAKMDLNLYVTLSECSPMTPLESISLGVPCIVGPTTTFFDDSPLLRSTLVVPSPEDIGSIKATVDAALRDYDAIAEEIIRLGYRREHSMIEIKKRLNSGARSSDGAADRAVVSLNDWPRTRKEVQLS
jgi:glycosyltransferase involved in cell wall biosynthesis